MFSEIGEGGGHNRSIYRRATDGAPAVRLAEGIAGAVSPDGKWVAAYRASSKQKVSLVPIGSGEEIPRGCPGLEDRLGNVVAWIPDGHRYLVRGHEPGKQGRIFVWDSSGSKLTPVSPEGTAFNDMLPAPGIGNGERPVNWLDSGKPVYVTSTRDGAKSFAVFRLDLATSKKVFWKEIKPAKPVDSVFNLRITPDGRSYAYNYSRTLSDLYLVEGL